MRKLLQISFRLDDIFQAAQQIAPYLQQNNMLAFSGDMGAGKTTFISALCKVLEVKDAVSSPTFALINEYHRTEGQGEDYKKIYHMDWYRIKDNAEAIAAGIEDCLLQKDSICLIEWPEKASGLLPRPFLYAQIHWLDASERSLEICLIEKQDTLPFA